MGGGMQIVLRQYAGLGNQLFRYAALRYYAKQYGAEMSISVDPARYAHSHGFPRPFLLSHYSIKAPIRERSLSDRFFLTGKTWMKPAVALAKRALRVQVFNQLDHPSGSLGDLPLGGDIKRLYLVGRWQSSVIVEQVAEELRSELTLKDSAKGKNLEVLNQIRRSRNPVSLHVRRGDCSVAAPDRIELPLAYYLEAISSFKERLGDPTFFVFSDDFPWVEKSLPRNIAMVFVEHNDDFNAHEDLRLMSSCHHHIISNSTFSWWGAWLNPRTDKIVIAPRQWYHTEDSCDADLLPKSWILRDVATPADRSLAEVLQ
jgi:Glycosyl transferase family 11